MQDAGYGLLRTLLRNCLKSGLSNARAVNLAGVRTSDRPKTSSVGAPKASPSVL
jgi:hypothetical protein